MLIDWIVKPFGSGWEHLEPDPIVWLDVALVEASIVLDETEYVGPGGAGAGQAGRYEVVGERFLRRLPMWMPHLNMNDEVEIAFTDGRHRFAWIRDHGARAFPTTTSPDDVTILLDRFGSSLRECRVKP